MIDTRNLLFIILLQLVVGKPQINLYFTDLVSVIQHDCLYITAVNDDSNVTREILSYCMSESPLKFNIQKNNHFPKFTFAELSKENITSQQLYIWSAPIDIIENYQMYLNSNDSSLETNLFYNCTLPRFGSMCQYQFDYHHRNHSSLYHMIFDFYRSYEYDSMNLTCYTHLQCDRGPYPLCLDWSEICDGKVDCRDGTFDEEHCWQLEINECKDDEYRCTNGQCIPQAFYLDYKNTPDCLDQSDEHGQNSYSYEKCYRDEPAFGSLKSPK